MKYQLAVFGTVALIVVIGFLHAGGYIDVATREQATGVLVGGTVGSAGTYVVMKRGERPAPGE